MTEQVVTPSPNSTVKLSSYDPAYTGDMGKEEAREAVIGLQEKLTELQEVLYAQGEKSLLIILQAMDAGGKDGTIKKVFYGVNPLGVRVTSFKAPSSEELAHDFLWRIHKQVPPRGMIGVFNRSHYEDVLIVRVNNLVPEKVWEKRYDQINAFEHLLAENGTRILKFYLHISKDEQKQRLQDRLNEPNKRWKFSVGDLPVREQWDTYMKAYEAALTRCNTSYAPWHIVPANEKWYRDWVVLKAIVDTLESMGLAYPKAAAGLESIVIPD